MGTALILAVAACLTGCATREARHRTLSFFFDGVPPLESPVPEAPPATEVDERPLEVAKSPTFSSHGPYAARRCEVCHQTASSNRLKTTRQPICMDCHDPGEFALPFLHGPAAAGRCGTCHLPHRSRLPHLLRSQGEELCAICHTGTTFPETDQHRARGDSDCLACHGAHGGENGNLLR